MDTDLTSENIEVVLLNHSNDAKAKILLRFFKTSKGDYGEGDIFIGLTVPLIRDIAKKYKLLPLDQLEILIRNEIHELRLCALLILTYRYPDLDPKQQAEIVDFYLRNIKYINNWDLVDLSAYKLVGAYIYKHQERFPELKILARSTHLWSRRVAILSMFTYIKAKEFDKPFEIIEMLIGDSHDLMHKAVGWMLREIGKRDKLRLKQFLDCHANTMPRTTLRYAIERLEEKERQLYLGMKKSG